MKLKKALLIIALLSAVSGVITLFKAPYGQPRNLRISLNLPLSGDLSVYGQSIREGVSFALKKERGLAQKNVKYDWGDNLSNPARSVSLAMLQLPQKPHIYVSGVRPQTMAIISQINETHIPHIVWIFDANIRKLGNNTFRTWVNYKIEQPVMTSYIVRKKAKSVAVAYVNLPHSAEAVENLLIPSLENQSIRAYKFPFLINNTRFKEIALRMKQTGADIFILYGFQNHLVSLVRALRESGISGNNQILGSYDMIDAAQVLSPEETQNIRVIAPKFMIAPTSKRYNKWREDFKSNFNKEPLYTHAYAYDMALLFGRLQTLADSEISNTVLLSLFDRVMIDGVTGPISFDKNGNIKTDVEVGRYANGIITKDNTVE